MPLDRTGEPVNDEKGTEAIRPLGVPAPRSHDCDAGWLDRDADHPRPCLICRPHLDRAVRRAELLAALGRHDDNPATDQRKATR